MVTATYGNTTINSTGGTILPFVSYKYDLCVMYNSPGEVCNAFFEIQRTGHSGDTVTVDSAYVDFFGQFGLYVGGSPPTITYTQMASLGLGSPDDPGEGVFNYSMKITLTSEAAPARLLMQPLEINIEVVESRN